MGPPGPKMPNFLSFWPDFWGKWAVLVSTGIPGPRGFISTEFRGFSLIPVPNGGHFDVFGPDFWDEKCLREAPEPSGAAGRPIFFFWLREAKKISFLVLAFVKSAKKCKI